ncbi:DUF6314 family protein [uncultured Pelagimonas sp.]|uniref:DUF6314 family protein n=1 Tax=uncultured Pelagimonas sp. TaxID=1618102 RepID=UPI00260A9A24|nr:DUF6314 family protein [uncultured Pelagimonas sp.]
MRQLSDFLGVWSLERDIRQADGSQAHFEGTARWDADDDGANYLEMGQLVMPGQGQFRSERRYRWGNDLRVYFDDGRYFHSVPADGGESAHWCDPDQYDASYDFGQWPNWSCQWTVRGPRKDYVIVGRYSFLQRFSEEDG